MNILNKQNLSLAYSLVKEILHYHKLIVTIIHKL